MAIEKDKINSQSKSRPTSYSYPNYFSRHNQVEDEEPCCATPNIVKNQEGMSVCSSCGVVVNREIIGHEKRAYTQREVNTRRQTEPRWRAYGPRTVIGLNQPDSKGQMLKAREKSYFNRLSKIQGSLVNSLERNFWEAKPRMSVLGRKLNLPEYILETAWKIYAQVAKEKLTMGRSINAFVVASIYAAIRIHRFPRLLEEIVDVAMTDRRAVHKSLGLIVRIVFPKLNMTYKPVNPLALVYRFGADLGLSIKLQRQASNMLVKAIKNGLNRIGKDPKGLAAAVLYIVTKPTEERITQEEIAEVTRITEVTLRTRAKQIKKHIK